MRFIPAAVSSKVAMTVLKTQKHSPTLLFAAGVVGIVGTVVLASRATLKLEEVLTEANTTLEAIETVDQHKDYSDQDRVKDKALVYVQTGIKIAKLYGPAVLVGAASIGALTGSHQILTRRNAALTAAYAAIEKGFREYRDRVVADLGEDQDRKYRYGVEEKKITVVDDDGKKTRVAFDTATCTSPYGRLFHEGNVNWKPLPEYNYLFLRGQENYLNDRLTARGFLFLSDVYDALGFEQTSASRVVGWLSKANGGTDGFVDFGIFDSSDYLRIHEYMVGQEGELFLDFNVDGTIYDKI